MDPRLRERIEVETLHEILSEIDCYKLLGLPVDAAQDAVEPAFRAVSRRLHPDRLAAGASPDFKTQANAVFRAIGEAHRTLRDPETRAAYDAERKAGAVRLAEESRRAVAAEAQVRADPSRAAKTPRADAFWRRGLLAFQSGDAASAVMQIGFALQLEPDNAVFQDYLARARQAVAERKGPPKG